jgi:OOP family OmpA-OmpF porin
VRPCRVSRLLLFTLLFDAATTFPAASLAPVPLIQGLTLVRAASERQGDYESTLIVDDLDTDGVIHLSAAAELPDPAGGKPTPVAFNRVVGGDDRDHARTYKYMFSTGAEEYPGTTAMGVSGDVIRDLRTTGKATITLDGQLGGLANLLSGFLQLVPGAAPGKPAEPYLSASGVIHVVEAKPVAYPMIVNDAVVSLSAWHVKGEFGEVPVPVDWYILDDPANPVTLRCAFGKDRLETIRVSFPVENQARSLETALAKDRRAVIYGIYFDFNSATIKPQSGSVLHAIADVMKKNPDWVLTVEGHTDNIGGAAANQDLSSRRAAAVRAALIQLDIPEQRLVSSAFGSSVPRDTNATLAGRARNRRVELTRQ